MTGISRKSLDASLEQLPTSLSAQDTKQPGMLLKDRTNRYPCDNVEANKENRALVRQMATAQISEELRAKGIYAGLLVVEDRCIELDDEYLRTVQNSAEPRNIQGYQWQVTIAIHRQFISDCHDFLLVPEPHSVTDALDTTTVKESMPKRMWFNGIGNLLNVMRNDLPQSLEYMLAFIHESYNILTHILETVSLFEDTWIECLGDLARYRWAIENTEDNVKWNRIAHSWYQKKASRNPHIGRLYHHLGLLARTHSLERLALFTKALTCNSPFKDTRVRIRSILKCVSEMPEWRFRQEEQCLDLLFIEAHGSLFSGDEGRFCSILGSIRGGTLEDYMTTMGESFKSSGAFAAAINISALFADGQINSNKSPTSIVRLAFEDAQNIRPGSSPSLSTPHGQDNKQYDTSSIAIQRASRLTFATLAVALRRPGDENVFPLIHVTLMFVWRSMQVPLARTLIQDHVPWQSICSFLNAMLNSGVAMPTACKSTFHRRDDIGPLPEDHIMRGHIFFEACFPDDWFESGRVEEEMPILETPGAKSYRTERIVWVGLQIAKV